MELGRVIPEFGVLHTYHETRRLPLFEKNLDPFCASLYVLAPEEEAINGCGYF